MATRATSEDEMLAMTVGELTPTNSPIVLAQYDPRWPNQFLHEVDRIDHALGPDALRIRHCGSTAVPGLAAKPIIDIALEVHDSSDEQGYARRLNAAGYLLCIREPAWYEHRMFEGPGKDVNLHVFTLGCPEVARMIAFRDWLRSDENDRRLYELAKRELAGKTWKYVQHYADAKTEVIAQILQRARAASSTG